MSLLSRCTSRRALWLVGAVALTAGVVGMLSGRIGDLLGLTATGTLIALIACLIPCGLAVVVGARLFRGRPKEPPGSC